jgi:hypothetical protein
MCDFEQRNNIVSGGNSWACCKCKVVVYLIISFRSTSNPFCSLYLSTSTVALKVKPPWQLTSIYPGTCICLTKVCTSHSHVQLQAQMYFTMFFPWCVCTTLLTMLQHFVWDSSELLGKWKFKITSEDEHSIPITLDGLESECCWNFTDLSLPSFPSSTHLEYSIYSHLLYHSSAAVVTS